MIPNRLLVTGAKGFVGRHFINLMLQSHGNEVHIIATDIEPQASTSGILSQAGWSGLPEGRVSVVKMDITLEEEVEQVLLSTKPDAILHLAARASGRDVDSEAVYKVNVHGTRNLLSAAEKLTTPPKTLLVSSGYVYGDTDPEKPAREEDELSESDKYGAYTESKIMVERLARRFPDFAMVARPFLHTGPGQSTKFALSSFAEQLAGIEKGYLPPTLKVGNLEALRDILDVRDVVRAYHSLLFEGESGTTYNIATGKPVTIGSALETLRGYCKVPTALQTDPDRLRPADISCSTGDPFQIFTGLNWSPRFSLNQTLQDLLDYWRGRVSAFGWMDRIK